MNYLKANLYKRWENKNREKRGIYINKIDYENKILNNELPRT